MSCRHRKALAALSLLGVLGCAMARDPVAVYAPASGLLSIPSVAVGAEVYVDVELVDIGGLTFQLRSATLLRPPSSAFATYDLASGVLTLPLVSAGTTNYHAVTLTNVGNYTFQVLAGTPAASPPSVIAPPRWLSTWSASTDTGYGDYVLSVLDPTSPSVQAVVDRLPEPGHVVRSVILGGTYDPTLLRVTDIGPRHIVYEKGSAPYRVTLDRSTPVVAAPIGGFLDSVATASWARSAGGDQVVAYTRSGDNTARAQPITAGARFGGLATPPQSGDLHAIGFLNDLQTGALATIVWQSATSRKAYLTDPQLTSWSVLSEDTTRDVPEPSMMRRGIFLYGPGTVRRYDAATRTTKTVFTAGSTLFPSSLVPLYDDDTLYPVVYASAARQQLLRCPDNAIDPCVVLADDPTLALQVPVAVLRQHLVFGGGMQVTSVRKADGLTTTISSPSYAVWSRDLLGGHHVDGDRILYRRQDVSGAGVRNVIGTIRADGTDRREFEGSIVGVSALASSAAFHRIRRMDRAPLDKTLVRIGNGTDVAWLDLVTGDVGPRLGSLPATPSASSATDAVLNHFGNVTTWPGTFGVGVLIPPGQPGGRLERLDGWFAGREGGSLMRLSNTVPLP